MSEEDCAISIAYLSSGASYASHDGSPPLKAVAAKFSNIINTIRREPAIAFACFAAVQLHVSARRGRYAEKAGTTQAQVTVIAELPCRSPAATPHSIREAQQKQYSLRDGETTTRS
jgi:hypothetical protein